jgi:hypothetical protein
MYHLLAGRPPFSGDLHMAILQQVMHRDPVSITLLTPGGSRDLNTLRSDDSGVRGTKQRTVIRLT